MGYTDGVLFPAGARYYFVLNSAQTVSGACQNLTQEASLVVFEVMAAGK
jgi:hypothetical protein